jgi:mannose-6-phosphate isomerase-like protein (cupin superfamily)
MKRFETKLLPAEKDDLAPDGSEVRILLRLERASMAHFQLPAGKTSRAVAHRAVEEIWYVISGDGEMWRKQGDREEVVQLTPNTCLTIPAGTSLQGS